ARRRSRRAASTSAATRDRHARALSARDPRAAGVCGSVVPPAPARAYAAMGHAGSEFADVSSTPACRRRVRRRYDQRLDAALLMAHRHFCTYFDHRYLAQGLALHESLARHCRQFTLWALALSPEAEHMLSALALPTLRVVPLNELEAFDSELRP